MRATYVAVTVILGLVMTFMPSAVSAAPGATPVIASPRIGAVFVPSVLGLAQAAPIPHSCSGSVVHSKSGNVVITAAHCIIGTGVGYEFAPGYHDGVFPFGLWTTTRVYVAAPWLTSHDPRFDYAFLTTAPKFIGGTFHTLEQVVGSYQLGTAPAAGTHVTVVGYVAGRNDEPLACRTVTYDTDAYPSINCDGFADGTSGGPWLEGDSLVGLIGGLHQGGCTPQTSYSPPLDATTVEVLARAASGSLPDVVLPAGNAGC